jgi:hypothetical protein
MKKENTMSTRKLTVALGFALVLGAPLAALAADNWEDARAGFEYHLTPTISAVSNGASPADLKPLKAGDISTDRLYVYSGGDGGWQVRQMEYRFQGDRLVMVDDPVGHMERHADTTPLTARQREALNSSRGN